ncbi:MAG: hypothetical protein E6J88_17990 [Deltaproteobacteria bacterium]|nr:MAG: hypothetical protein E6J88_17990 [Deltaproteobacteria bacterium]
MPSAAAAFEISRQGTLRIDAKTRTEQKCTTVGVPKARTSALPAFPVSTPISVITTNCRPVSAAAEEPTMT